MKDPHDESQDATQRANTELIYHRTYFDAFDLDQISENVNVLGTIASRTTSYTLPKSLRDTSRHVVFATRNAHSEKRPKYLGVGF